MITLFSSLTAEFQQLGTTNDLDPPAEQIDPKLCKFSFFRFD